ncbi:RpiB/LacA/LacB family sugar-phosphate isomerase [Mycoplasmopsis caviae]|uniref:Ribose-5-phosphate isomerase n=1 Tax=Mycoplasmopsis caviae TaxID=55603 RepID=A0A3P8L708_9BACT|nr:RpiB/LacA/LacB family sugar-phosphate isomerase [Mycoplasmopsis caviae]UUD35336.1 RpiB/LacA/LacB family sugar-phosphate isomerase [Mycoplasmopsis caviae]VDR41885.1 ribose-5-phosphate isomerase [Mycoplasmopsis caviae]
MNKNKIVALASDHGGCELKNQMAQYAESLGYQVVDLGPADSSKSISYAEQGHKLANYINEHKNVIGLGFCGTGLGISYALNRHKHIRAARVVSVEDARLAKLHNNANVLVMGGRYVPFADAKAMFNEYLKTEYEGGRHQVRIDQIDEI